MSLGSVGKDLHALVEPERAKLSQSFFKTGKGHYSEGDVFIGIRVPLIRSVAIKYFTLPYADIRELLHSHIHEERLLALEILVHRYEKDIEERERIYQFYLDNIQQVNNWDLVDATAAYIVGVHLQNKSKKQLYELAKSKNLWEKRIAIVSTHAFIKHNQFADTFAISEQLMNDTHDLIHKAIGWSLREVGKKNKAALVTFLRAHAATMPRTSLRYAIERFTPKERKEWLAMKHEKPVKTKPFSHKTSVLLSRISRK